MIISLIIFRAFSKLFYFSLRKLQQFKMRLLLIEIIESESIIFIVISINNNVQLHLLNRLQVFYYLNIIEMSRQPALNRAKNILGLEPYSDQFFGVALDSLRRTLLDSKESIDKIEIEVKYAEFKYFSNCFNPNDFREVKDENLKNRFAYLMEYQSNEYFKGLQILSKQNILYLNPLSRRVYQLASGFKQQVYRKFYHIREFLIKMCKHNQLNNYTLRPISLHQGPVSIYHELSLNNFNYLLKIIEQDELRLDVYIKEGAPQSLRGRYSYSNKIGWSKTQKMPLCTQMDFMLNERTFRFAINRQIQSEVEPQTLKEIGILLKNNPKMTDIRLKRLLRVAKGQISEYALSQIYNINEQNKNNNPQFPLKICAPMQELNAFLKKIFINFYSKSQKEFCKFEIESEFTKVMTKHIQKLLSRGQFSEVKHQIQSAIEQLYAFYYSDHATKVKEVPWLNAKAKEATMPETRLENQFGNYMRNEIYQSMKRGP